MKINNIQTVRSIAALYVLFYHAGYHIGHLHQFGAFSVDTFFLISGFMMARLVLSESPGQFVYRRVTRVLPLYWSATIGVFLLSLYVPAIVGATKPEIGQLIKSLFFVPFVKSNGLIQPILFLGWTLNYEMLFYAAVTIGMVVWRKHAAALASALLVFIFLAARVYGKGVIGSFYGDPILFELIGGMAIYHLYTRLTPATAIRLRPWAMVTGGVALITVNILEALALDLKGPRVLTLGILSFFLLLSVVTLSKSGFDRKWKAAVLLGDASYSLYLIHPYIVNTILKLTTNRLAFLDPSKTLLGLLFTFAITLAVSFLVYQYFERPVQMFLRGKRDVKKVTSREVPIVTGEPALNPAS